MFRKLALIRIFDPKPNPNPNPNPNRPTTWSPDPSSNHNPNLIRPTGRGIFLETGTNLYF